MKKLDVKGIIFDYGGTLDTRGDHWSEVIWKAYLHFGMGFSNVDFGLGLSDTEREIVSIRKPFEMPMCMAREPWQ